MNNFEMYQPSAWSDHGLTHHVATAVKANQVNVKRIAKKALIIGSLIAVSLANLTTSGLPPAQISEQLVIKQSLLNVTSDVTGSHIVPIGFWPQLSSVINAWKSVESISTEHDPEPLI